MAPWFWPIPRKEYRFTTKPSPGPHPKGSCYSLLVLIRDVLKAGETADESKKLIKLGRVSVDGKVRRDHKFPVGLMDVISFTHLNLHYRLLPSRSSPLVPVKINEEESRVKLCKITKKTTVRGGKIAYTLHDGRNILCDLSVSYKPGDSLLILVPDQRVIDSFPLEQNNLAIITNGKNLGLKGRIREVREGTFTKPKTVIVETEEGPKETIADYVLVIGKEKPALFLGDA